MFVFGNFFAALGMIFQFILNIMYWLIIIRVLISWVSPDPFNPIVQFLFRATEPILEPIRRRLPVMSLDVSPIIAILLIWFVQSFLVQTLYDLGSRIR